MTVQRDNRNMMMLMRGMQMRSALFRVLRMPGELA